MLKPCVTFIRTRSYAIAQRLPVDAADSKGEPIHQTLMAKKMQRLDESPDFRPFKFRIAAFTNAFLEEVSLQNAISTGMAGFILCSSPDKDILKKRFL